MDTTTSTGATRRGLIAAGLAALGAWLWPRAAAAQHVTPLPPLLPSTSTIALGGSSGTGTMQAGATIQTSAVTVTTTAESDLMTYSLAASAFNATNRGLYVYAWGTAAANTTSKSIRMLFGTTQVMTTGTTVLNGVSWALEGWVLRSGASAQEVLGNGQFAATALAATQTTSAQTDTAAITVKCVGLASVTQTGMVVEFIN